MLTFPVTASAIISGGRASPEVMAVRRQINAEFTSALATPIWYWLALGAGVAAGALFVRRMAHREDVRLSVLSFILPIAALTLVLAIHFRIRHVMGQMAQDIYLTEYSPVFWIKLPFLAGSSIVGAILIAGVWTITHPSYLFLHWHDRKWAKSSLSYLPGIAVGIGFLVGFNIWFAVAISMIG